jgi:hypothetical protein
LGDERVIAVEGDDFSVVRERDRGDQEIERSDGESAVAASLAEEGG